ncbi:hypothetical protein SAY87_012742 [Trapa incisa]|uniref:K-box domain-containing protein n=1 Tax=Trapa incisa TaxID=236973 RepID=A0AAN7GQZ8_9MYRT|nr:hypothetical protein SAY87_012742 [Trapa incisa]
MQGTLERYRKHTKGSRAGQPSMEEGTQHMKDEAISMMKKMELLEDSKRKLLGEGLASCTIEDLQNIEQQLEYSISKIRARKTQVYIEQIGKLKEKEKTLKAENAVLSEKCGLTQSQRATQAEVRLELETDLLMAQPETRLRLASYFSS